MRRLLRSVELARRLRSFPTRRVLVAGSLGPYGAALHNGGEYHGNYDCSYADLVRFHRERIEVFAQATGRSGLTYSPLKPSLRSKKRAP
jgi:homocysteine S-methyltransferase